jgi:hypothetical protein
MAFRMTDDARHRAQGKSQISNLKFQIVDRCALRPRHVTLSVAKVSIVISGFDLLGVQNE